MTRSRLMSASCLLIAWTMTLTLAAADDWPQWRGLNRDGVWHETGVLKSFASDQLKPRWTAKIGPGYSGPTVADGRVFVTDRIIEPKQQERVHCFDALSGKQLWTHVYDCPYSIGYKAGPRASVSVDSGRAYSLGGMGHLICFDAATGKIQWKHDLNTEYKIRMPIWGIAASPIVVDKLLIVQVGGSDGACLVAFDKDSGKEVWRALPDTASYSAPILIQQAGRSVLVCWVGQSVNGLDPVTGKVFWSHPFPPKNMVISIATPVLHENRLFMTSFYDGSLMLELDPKALKAKPLWQRSGESELKTDALHSIIATPLMLGDHIYGVDSYGELRCLEASTGDRVWEDLTATPKARWSNIHMVRNQDRIWMFNERGELIIAKLSPQGFDEISRTKLIEPTLPQLNRRNGVCWAHPAFANRHIFVRSDDQLACFNLAAE